jgi:hypothetical protein
VALLVRRHKQHDAGLHQVAPQERAPLHDPQHHLGLVGEQQQPAFGEGLNVLTLKLGPRGGQWLDQAEVEGELLLKLILPQVEGDNFGLRWGSVTWNLSEREGQEMEMDSMQSSRILSRVSVELLPQLQFRDVLHFVDGFDEFLFDSVDEVAVEDFLL